MISHPSPNLPPGQAPCFRTSIVQHNSLGSWDVFLSLFESLVGSPHTDIVLLQDPPSSKGFLPRFAGFKSFAPPSPRPRVAIYVSLSFCSQYPILPGFHDDTTNAMFLDVYTPGGCFGTSAPKFRINNIYAREAGPHGRTVSPQTALQQVDFPLLVAGDFNIHNPASDPLRVFSYKEELESAPFFALASERGFRLLNTPGVYTRFPLAGSNRPGVIDLAFANPLMPPAFEAWDASSLPSTGSDHVPILITLASPNNRPKPRTPCWDLTNWDALRPHLEAYQVPPAPTRPSPAQIDQWCSSSLNTLTALLLRDTPLSRPSPRSKPWWTPLLTALRKEYHKAMRTLQKHPTENNQYLAKLSQTGYFKAIKRAKGSYWSSFLARTTPQNIWTAKQYIGPQKDPPLPVAPRGGLPVGDQQRPPQTLLPPQTRPCSKGKTLPLHRCYPTILRRNQSGPQQKLSLFSPRPGWHSLWRLEEGRRHKPRHPSGPPGPPRYLRISPPLPQAHERGGP